MTQGAYAKDPRVTLKGSALLLSTGEKLAVDQTPDEVFGLLSEIAGDDFVVLTDYGYPAYIKPSTVVGIKPRFL